MEHRTFGRYRVIKKIGEGGMGQVYGAEDTSLRRQVAIKVISETLERNVHAHKRFIREAQSAAALVHPFICSIHEVGQSADGRDFIVMEYVQGETLRDWIDREPFAVGPAVRIASELVEALEFAHNQGIIHRDIKPSNIMLTEQGHIKILDFGVAKQIKSLERDDNEETLSSLGSLTPGTLSYMSPEQLTGKPVDQRTDIFSLGVVIQEMLTGVHPFAGRNPIDTANRVIGGRYRSLKLYLPDADPLLQHIIRKMLATDCRDRYQSAHEIGTDLKQLCNGHTTLSANQFDESSYSEDTEFAGQQGSRSKGAHLMRWVAALAAVSVVVGLGLWWGGWFSSRPLPEFRPTQVTHSSAWEGQPALSPDGGRIAYTSNEAGNSDIFLIDVRGGYPQNLTSSEARDRDPAWFPDGSALAFSSDRGGQTGIWKVGQLGGDPVLLIPAGAQPAISPDGEKIAFVRPDQEGTYRVAVASLENPADSILLTSSGDGFWDHFEPAWSPDGRWICYSARHNLWIVPREGGPAHRLTSQNEHDFSPIWSPDGEFIYFASEREGIQALWRIPSSGGLAERVTVGTGQEGHPDISQSALKMVYSTGAPDRSLLLYNRDSGNETVLSEISDDWMASINRDASQVVYVSSRWGAELNLALQDLRGGHPEKTPRRLGAQEGIPSHPRFSNDGRWVAYYQIIGEERDIYVIGIEEGLPRRFTETPSTEMHPDWSPDDSQVVFVSDRGGRPSVWINSIENGLPVGSSRPLDVGEVDLAYAPVWIADGSGVAFVGRDTEGSEVWLVETEEGARARRLTSGAEAMRVRYDARTGGLLVSGLWGEDNLSVRSVSLTTGEALPLNPPLVLGKTGDLPLFDASSDGEILLFTRENRRGDIWLIESTNGVF